MKLLATVLVCAFLLAGPVNAQDKMSLGAGPLVSIPIGDFSDGANTGFGGTASFELGFLPQLTGIGQIGYISWGTDMDDYSVSGVPVLVGIKYYFLPGMGFYGTGQLGLTFMSISFPNTFVYDESTSSTEFTILLGAGYEIPVAPNVALDFTGAFNFISDANNFMIRAGAKFGL